jgi:cytoskeleton protein RodZ
MASLGQSLREEREARNISIEEIASATKIVPRYLEALEADHLDMMPGGFFVKGIIRTYARAVGLNPDEVLARYKAAGLLGGPDPGRHAAPKILLEPAPPMAPTPMPAPALGPVQPAEQIPSPEPGPSPVQETVPELIIEEAPKPKLSADARKRILTWAWRGGGALLIVVVLVVLWSSRRQRPPQVPPAVVVSQEVLPTSQKAGPGSEPASKPSLETSSKSEPPPVVEDVWKGVTIEITFQAETWIVVHADGEIKIEGLFPAGATARAQANEKLLIETGNAGGFTFRLNGRPAKPLGRVGQLLNDIQITRENLKDFLEGQPTGPSTG